MKLTNLSGVIGSRWAVQLLLAIDEQTGSLFSELIELEGLSRRVLSEQLAALLELKLIRRERYLAKPVRYRYLLTDKGFLVRQLLKSAAHVCEGGQLLEDPLQIKDSKKGELGSSEELLAIDVESAQKIYEESISPLVVYDKNYKTSLVETLRTWFLCNSSISATAARLFTHRHTIRYRLDRIHEITDINPNTTEGKERLLHGLRAKKIIQDSVHMAKD